MTGIYKITSPSAKVYIGQSLNIEKRWKQYKNNLAKGQRALNYSFTKYGVENHVFEIICECETSELNEKERYYQELFNAMGKKGLNLTLTETTMQRRLVSSFFSESLSKRNKERIWSDESRKKIADKSRVRMKGNSYKKGFKHDDVFKEKRRNIMLGNKNTLGRKYSKEIKEKLSKSSTRKILLLDTSTGIFYESIKEASFVYNYAPNTLAMKLKGYKNKSNNTTLIIA